MEKKLNFNISIIAGYNVLADTIPNHVYYVSEAVNRSTELDADLIIFVGGATNPDYPDKTEAQANCEALSRTPIETIYNVWDIEDSINKLDLLNIIKKRNSEIKSRSRMCGERLELLYKVLPIGNTSAETLEAAKEFIEKNKIPVGRIILCAEQSRIAGFMLDALMVGLLDSSEQIFTYGHPFPESKQGFDSQRKKMLFKVLSHHSAFFRLIREISQKFHQHKVARLKRKQK